jgi:hypothetical protein
LSLPERRFPPPWSAEETDSVMVRRVLDMRDYSEGTAVEEVKPGWYRVEWDAPTPWQHEARVPIPSTDFQWKDQNG